MIWLISTLGRKYQKPKLRISKKTQGETLKLNFQLKKIKELLFFLLETTIC